MSESLLKKAVKKLNIKFPVARLSREMEYSQGVISEYLNGKREMSEAFKEKFEKIFSFSFSELEIVGAEKIGTNDAKPIFYNDEVEIFTNKNGIKFQLYPDDTYKIEVLKIPFPAYATYLEVYNDEEKLKNEFTTTTFKVDKIAKGYYLAFDIKNDSMNGGGIDDTPNGAEILAREIGRHLWNGKFRHEKYGYILMTKKNIYHKDIKSYDENTGMLTLSSRNPLEQDFELSINDVFRIFNVIKRTF